MAGEKLSCVQCNKSIAISNFYETKNTFFFPAGKINVCKNCIADYVKNGDMQSILYVLMALDKPFISDLWDTAKSSETNNVLGVYLRSLSVKPWKDLSHKDSQFSSNKEIEIDHQETDTEFEEIQVITPAMRKRWLGHKNTEDILFLENYYQEMTSKYECDTPIQEHLYKNMATTQLEDHKALLRNDISAHEKLMKTMSTLMGDAKLKPVQDTGEDSSGLATWGQWVKKIEETEPIPEPREEFKDVDGIWKYIKRWFIDHFARVFDLKQEDSHEESGEVHG